MQSNRGVSRINALGEETLHRASKSLRFFAKLGKRNIVPLSKSDSHFHIDSSHHRAIYVDADIAPESAGLVLVGDIENR